MKTNKLSIAALVLTGAFATGCSQQQVAGDSGASQSAGSQQVAGGSQTSGGSQQVAGGSQTSGGSQQSAGGSQVSGGGSQQAGSQQQVETPTPAVAKTQPPAQVAEPKAPPANRVAPARRYQNPWAHYHAEAPACAKTKKHSHKYNKTGAPHRHSYGCNQPRRVAPQPRQPQVDVFALQRKLKAKGYYKGPIDGVVGAGTRSALKRFMQR